MSVQQWVMGKWRLDVEHAQGGIDKENDMPKLVDPRFADELFIFARIAREI